jgi:hypothetical protein
LLDRFSIPVCTGMSFRRQRTRETEAPSIGTVPALIDFGEKV